MLLQVTIILSLPLPTMVIGRLLPEAVAPSTSRTAVALNLVAILNGPPGLQTKEHQIVGNSETPDPKGVADRRHPFFIG